MDSANHRMYAGLGRVGGLRGHVYHLDHLLGARLHCVYFRLKNSRQMRVVTLRMSCSRSAPGRLSAQRRVVWCATRGLARFSAIGDMVRSI